MATIRTKLDYNNLIGEILEVLTSSEDEIVKENAFGIGIGLELLTSYLKDIATLAINRNDKELLELCQGLMIVKESKKEVEE